MPLIHNDSATRPPSTPPAQSLVSSLHALKAAQQSDAVIASIGLANAREALAGRIAQALNRRAELILAGQEPPAGKIQYHSVGAVDPLSLTPTDSRFTAEQFKSRGFDTVATLLDKYSGSDRESVLEREVLTPLKEQLEAAGFTDVSFGRGRMKLDGTEQTVLTLSLNAPQE